MTNETLITEYGYRLFPRAEFIEACVSTGQLALMERATAYQGAWVFFDPEDDEDGFLLVGDDAHELATKAIEHLELEPIDS